MRVVSRGAALAALLTPVAKAVSLSDMTPRAQNLPSDCNQIYTSQISGCGVQDFMTSTCTQSCVSALQAMVGPIQKACGGQGVTGSNLVVAFLANVGPQQICSNAPADTGEDSSSTAEQQQPSSKASPTPTPTPSPSTTSTSAAETTEASSSAKSSQSLLVDTSSRESTQTRTRTQAFSGTTTAPILTSQSFAPTRRVDRSSTETTTTTPAAASQTSKSKQTEDDGQQAAETRSGGGSPFDAEGNMFSGADSLSSTSVLVSLGIAFVVVMILFR